MSAPPGVQAGGAAEAGALRGARVLLGVSGGIAAYKAVELARLLIKAGASVQVVMTEAAKRFVGEATFASLTRNPVASGVFDRVEQTWHVKLGRDADVTVIAPATANVIAKMAHGIADDMLSSVMLTVRCPIVVAPAMHTEMWQHPATRANVATLVSRGVVVVSPEEGELAGGDQGIGRLAEPAAIALAVAGSLAHGRDLAGLAVLVTAGGTQEPIDPIRFIGNRSSGKMGFALAREAALRGAAVTLVTGPTWLEDPPGCEVVRVRTAAEMLDAVLSRFEATDVVVKAAAVGDFRPIAVARTKIKKDSAPSEIRLESTTDILAELGRRKSRQLLVGFSAETDDAVPRARKKLAAKNLDMIVVNVVGSKRAGFEVDTNQAVVIAADGSEEELPLQTKSAMAREIFARIATRVRGAQEGKPAL